MPVAFGFRKTGWKFTRLGGPVLLFFLACLVASVAAFADDKPDAEKPGLSKVEGLLRQLDDADYQIREMATKKLIELWEDDAVLKRVEEVNKAAKENGRAEIERRSEQILRNHQVRRAFGSEVVHSVGSERFTKIAEGDSALLFEIFRECFKSPEKYHLTDETVGKMAARIVAIFDNAARQFLVSEPFEIVRKSSEKENQWRIPFAAALLKDASPKIRTNAALTLTTLSSKSHIKDIALLLKDESADVRAYAAYALGYLGAKEYAKEIAALLHQEDVLEDQFRTLKGNAIEALERLDAKEYAAEIAALVNEKELFTKITALSALGTFEAREYGNVIVPLLKNPDGFIRGIAAGALARMGLKEYSKDIIPLLKDPAIPVRDGAAKALAMLALDDPKAMAELLNHEDALVRSAVVISLADHGDQGAKHFANDIAALLKDNDGGVRTVAAYALAKLGASEYKMSVAKLLKDSDQHARGRAVWAMSVFDAKDCAVEIAKLLDDTGQTNFFDQAAKRWKDATVGEIAARVLEDWGMDVEKLKKEAQEKK